MPSEVTCSDHGKRRAAFICDHLFASRATKTAVGLTWFEEEGDIQAFCDDCWTCDIEEFQRRAASGPRVVCIDCLDAIAVLNDTWLDLGHEETPLPNGEGV